MVEVYRLRATIAAHTNDVRAVSFVGNDRLLTTSRDGTAKLSGEGLTTDIVSSGVFLNSCCSTPKTAFVGAIDGSITLANLETGELRFLLGHEGNVASLSLGGKQLVSGSWDTTVRVWDTDTAVQTALLTGHTQYVWDAQFVDAQTVVSASADRTLRVWDLASQTTTRVLNGHTDVVRAVLVLSPDTVLSASNDGTIKKWDLASGECTATWHGHTSFVYSLTQLSPGLVASGGEDRTVRLWNSQGENVQTIMMPAISQWDVCSNELGELAVASSDNTARIFTPIAERQADLAAQQMFDEAVRESAIGESEISESDVKPAEVLNGPGEQEGQVVIVRKGKTLEAHQYSAGKWSKIGDVVGSSQSSGSKRETYNGKQYDYVFDVDIADGQLPLKLPFNNSDNPYIAAEKFVIENGLPTSYTDQVVKFLITNSEAKELGQAASGSVPGSAPGSASGPAPGPASAGIPPILQYSTPVFLKSFQKESLLRALGKIADEKGENLGIYHLESVLSSLPSSSTDLLGIATELYTKWSTDIQSLLPVYDLLRLALADAVTIPYQVVWTQLLSALDAQVPKHCMLAVRGVANLVGNAGFDAHAKIHAAMLPQALAMVATVGEDSPTFSKPLAVALATLLLNLAVRHIPSAALIKTVAPKITAAGDAEAEYRLLLAVGLRSVAGEGSDFSASWFKPSEPRTVELFEIVKPKISS